MSIALNIEPDGIAIKEIPGKSEEGEDIVAARIITLVDARTGISVNVGPFVGEEGWQEFLDYLADPEAATAKQEARARIAVISGGEPMPKMEVPRGT